MGRSTRSRRSNLAHGGPGVVDDDLAQVDDVEDDRSSPGTVEELN